MSRAIEDLLHDHEAILSALNLLANINRKLETASPVDAGDLSAFVGFLKEFADNATTAKKRVCCSRPWPKPECHKPVARWG